MRFLLRGSDPVLAEGDLARETEDTWFLVNVILSGDGFKIRQATPDTYPFQKSEWEISE